MYVPFDSIVVGLSNSGLRTYRQIRHSMSLFLTTNHTVSIQKMQFYNLRILFSVDIFFKYLYSITTSVRQSIWKAGLYF